MSKEEVYYEEARRLYLTGKTLQQIAEFMPVSYASLSAWKRKGDWGAEKAAQVNVRSVADTLRAVLEAKVNKIVAKGDLDRAEADEIAKIAATIERLGQSTYSLRSAAVEVMRHFTAWAKGQLTDRAEAQRLAELVQNWFRELE